MRGFWISVVLAVLVLMPFLLWGGRFEEVFTREGAVEWLRGYGDWAWAAGLVLLILDLVLPLPSTVIMSAMGFVYGPLLGGLIAAAGSFLAGSAGYVLCRYGGRRVARSIAGEKGMRQSEHLFMRAGGWLVALSRCLPLLSEVVACMAGLTRMPVGRYFAALACGVIPVGFVFAAIGSSGMEHAGLAVLLSLVLPVIFWLITRRVFDGYLQPGAEAGEDLS